ncbi:MAG: hypothetical protein CL424_04365 [Acidimicrobiaceae bacterium]|nr:hypothetical protein [Acidimicrobiaceae bacterium]
MALTESQRLDLYERVKLSSLGEEGARIVMNAIPTIDWTDLATHDDLALLRSDLTAEMADLRADFRIEMGALENRLQRSLVTWILAAQGVTLATLGLLVTVLTLVLA